MKSRTKESGYYQVKSSPLSRSKLGKKRVAFVVGSCFLTAVLTLLLAAAAAAAVPPLRLSLSNSTMQPRVELWDIRRRTAGALF